MTRSRAVRVQKRFAASPRRRQPTRNLSPRSEHTLTRNPPLVSRTRLVYPCLLTQHSLYHRLVYPLPSGDRPQAPRAAQITSTHVHPPSHPVNDPLVIPRLFHSAILICPPSSRSGQSLPHLPPPSQTRTAKRPNVPLRKPRSPVPQQRARALSPQIRSHTSTARRVWSRRWPKWPPS